MDQFVPNKDPEFPDSALENEYRSRDAVFGDGYSQSSTDGINAHRRRPTLVWRVLDTADADQVQAFFDGHVGERFLYTLPWESTERVWRCTASRRRPTGPDRHQVTADLVQDFNL